MTNTDDQPHCKMCKPWRQRYDSMVDASIEQGQTIAMLQQRCVALEQEKTRLERELMAANNNVQMLGTDYNSRDAEKNREIERLRDVLKMHNISPEF